MFKRTLIVSAFLVFACNAPAVFGQSAPSPSPAGSEIATPQSDATVGVESADTAKQEDTAGNEALGKILDGLEARYSSPGFTARFNQESILRAMDIADSASGTLTIKRPGMMRWEYETPEPQTIVTDGEELWIYRPDDNQVMVGKAPAFFKNGKGAGFLSDMKLLREKFEISLDSGEKNKYLFAGDAIDGSPEEKKGEYYLKLVPEDKNIDLAAIFLAVDKESFKIDKIVTLNAYEDETKIGISDYRFGVDIANDLFRFSIPEGVDVLEMEE